MKTKTPDQVLDEIARDGVGPDINLSSGLQAKMRKVNENKMKTRKGLAVFAAIVIVVVVLISIPSVAQAIGRLFGYVPGAGFVEQNSTMRVLKEPVEVKSGDITISVSQAVVDAEHTTLIYQVKNIPGAETATTDPLDYCHAIPRLQLADSRQLDARTITGNFWGSGYSRQVEFEALPANENSAKLVFSCVELAPITKDATPIELQLEFIPAPADMAVYPLVNLPTPTLQVVETGLTDAPLSTSSKIALELNKYVQTDDQLILFGALKTGSTEFRLSYFDSQAVKLLDKDGNDIPIEEVYNLPDPEGETRGPQNLLFTYQTGGRYLPGEATLVIDNVWIDVNSSLTFEFDPGENPQPGQVWKLDQSLEIDGQTVRIKDATLDKNGDGFMFGIETPENLTNLSLMDLEHPMSGGGGGSDSTGFTYRDGLPTGKITITLTSYAEKINGPWLVEVDLPAFADGTLPTPMPEACLTKASWDAALLSSTREMPATLGGKLILADILPPDNYYHVLSADLSGAEAINLGLGDSGSLSPDGKTVVFATQEGLKFINLETNETIAVPDTSRRDRGPIWSSDGTRIAFSRGPSSGLIGAPGPYALMLMNADGSNQTVLLEDSEANFAQTWIPSSSTLLYTVMGPNGSTVKSIDTVTGEISILTNLNYQNAGVAVSPNGKQIAYEVMLPGDKYGVYISSLDGSNARLIANADPFVVTIPQWSPDGEWLAVTVQGDASTDYSLTIALVNPNTCQVIATSSLKGYVTSWR